MDGWKRVLTVVILTATALSALLTMDAARGQPPPIRNTPQVLKDQGVVAHAPKPLAPVAKAAEPVSRTVKAKAQPVRADMATLDSSTRPCGSQGAETKLGMLQNSAVYGHCK